MIATALTELLRIHVPVVQGGISISELMVLNRMFIGLENRHF